MVSYEWLQKEGVLYNHSGQSYSELHLILCHWKLTSLLAMHPESPKLSTESSITMTEESVTTTVVELEHKHPQCAKQPPATLRKSDKPILFYINVTTPPASPKDDPVSQLTSGQSAPIPPISMPSPVPLSDSSTTWDTSTLPDFLRVFDSLQEHGSKGNTSAKCRQQQLPVSKPKYSPAPFPTPPHPLLPLPALKGLKDSQPWGVFPDNNDSSDSDSSEGTQQADKAASDLAKLTLGDSLKNLNTRGKCPNICWVVSHGKVMGIYEDQ